MSTNINIRSKIVLDINFLNRFRLIQGTQNRFHYGFKYIFRDYLIVNFYIDLFYFDSWLIVFII